MSKFKIIDCSKTCRMSNTLKSSSYCNKTCRIEGNDLTFGCQENIKDLPANVRQMYDCNYWDLELYEMCTICELDCVNNKNENLEKIKESKKKIEGILDSLTPGVPSFGMDAETIERIVDVYKNGTLEEVEAGAEAIQAAEVAQKILSSAMNGGHIDIAYFKEFAKHATERISKKAKKN